MKSRTEGIAIVVVIVVAAVTMLTALFASSALSLASRGSASSDRNSTQALLAADSGLKTLKARGATIPYSSSDGSFANWIATNFSTLDLGDGVSATISVVGETPDAITVQSIGAVGPFRRTIVQEFELVIGPPVPLSATVPGALTSVGSIKSNSGSARVYGKPNTDAAWTTTQMPIISKSSTTYRDALACDALANDYFEMLGTVYAAVDASACPASLTARRVSDGVVMTLAGGSKVGIRGTAIAEPLPSPMGNPLTSTIMVSEGTRTLFGIDSPISIGGNSMGKVVGIDGNEFTIEWTVAPGPQPEGTVVRREISSGVTMGQCPSGGKVSTTFPQGCESGVDLTNLFYKTFHVASPNLLKESLPSASRLSGSVKGKTLSGITWVTNPDNNFRDQVGSGVLIIETNPGQTLNLNVSNDFIGLIYVIGDADIQGNAQYHGAIMVDGKATVDTAVQGTTDIHYDPLHLMRALAGLTVPNPNPGGLGQALNNTWRIK
mgnify:CR=1 FL=1